MTVVEGVYAGGRTELRGGGMCGRQRLGSGAGAGAEGIGAEGAGGGGGGGS